MTITKKLLKKLRAEKESLIISTREINTALLLKKYEIKSEELTKQAYDELAKIQMSLENNRRFIREVQIEANLLTELINL